VIMSFPGLYNLSLYVDYQIDMDEYVERCENRDVPMMNCEGKCLLAKKIKQANEDDRPESPSFLTEFSTYLQTDGIEMLIPSFSQILVWMDDSSKPRPGPSGVFRPPLMWFLFNQGKYGALCAYTSKNNHETYCNSRLCRGPFIINRVQKRRSSSSNIWRRSSHSYGWDWISINRRLHFVYILE